MPQHNSESDSLSGSTTYFVGAFAGAILGASLGGLCGFVLPEVYYKVTNPDILNDGQWGMIYLLSVLGGVIIGSLLGIIAGLFVARRIK